MNSVLVCTFVTLAGVGKNIRGDFHDELPRELGKVI